MEYLLIILIAIFVLFLPGYSISYILFKPNQIDAIERFALSVALSVSLVPLITFYANLLGLPINKFSISAVTLIIILFGTLISLIRNRKNSIEKGK